MDVCCVHASLSSMHVARIEEHWENWASEEAGQCAVCVEKGG